MTSVKTLIKMRKLRLLAPRSKRASGALACAVMLGGLSCDKPLSSPAQSSSGVSLRDVHTGHPIEITYGIHESGGGPALGGPIPIIVVGKSVGPEELIRLLKSDQRLVAKPETTIIYFANTKSGVKAEIPLVLKLGAELSNLKSGEPSEVLRKLGY